MVKSQSRAIRLRVLKHIENVRNVFKNKLVGPNEKALQLPYNIFIGSFPIGWAMNKSLNTTTSDSGVTVKGNSSASLAASGENESQGMFMDLELSTSDGQRPTRNLLVFINITVAVSPGCHTDSLNNLASWCNFLTLDTRTEDGFKVHSRNFFAMARVGVLKRSPQMMPLNLSSSIIIFEIEHYSKGVYRAFDLLVLAVHVDEEVAETFDTAGGDKQGRRYIMPL
ncbi:hypothetical protein ARMGADRAFT_1103697 [Armillaria gallica]|uniref:Uncharacterized protein n=1 Tax=Armillaria gallica TaxID=47427 RepID=A0A2H3DB98_ARMGA|nr:hypothetical protein ARMGADRAFT_1103697 [Armillaria gallica]